MLGLAGVAATALRAAWLRGRERRQATPVRVCDLEPGWVEVMGRVVGEASLHAPISGRTALGYWAQVEEERGPTAWQAVVIERRLAEFELDDGTGRVVVRVDAGAVASDLAPRRGHGGPFKVLPGRVERLLRANRRDTQGVLFGKAFRWSEQLLQPGDEVRVRAWARAVPDDRLTGTAAVTGGYRSASTLVVLTGTAEQPLQIIDVGESTRRPLVMAPFTGAHRRA